LNVDIKEIPVRLLQSAGDITTSRIAAFLEFILEPISAGFCKNCPNEFCQDSRQYIGDLLIWKEHLAKKLETAKQKPVFYIVAANVKALYPSLYRDTVTKALECALEKHSDYSAEARKIIIELNKICLNNVVTQYGDQLYIQKNGFITGDNHSVSLANIAVHYILQPIADVLNEAELFRRFIDDITWISASEISNARIRQALTSAFESSGLELTFGQTCTAEKTGEVEFLDVNHCVTIEDDFGFVTKDFVKPTAEGRQFINGSSHHPQQTTFKSVLFGEAIRLRRLNHRKDDYLSSSNRL